MNPYYLYISLAVLIGAVGILHIWFIHKNKYLPGFIIT